MMNKGEKGAMVFVPDLVKAAPGDTIRFVPTDKTHSADTCCVTGHGCHGLHSLMASESSHDAFAVSTHAFNALHSQLAGGAYSARHERPKWPAA